MNFFSASLKSLKNGVVPGVGSGSISQRYGSADPDPHQNVTDPQHWFSRARNQDSVTVSTSDADLHSLNPEHDLGLEFI